MAETQVSFVTGVFTVVGSTSRSDTAQLTVLVTVRCLECGEIYSKPRLGGTVEKNPGCPNCGYVGWLSVSLQPELPLEPHRSVGDRLRRPYAQQR